jgi:uncharacterized protein YkwD
MNATRDKPVSFTKEIEENVRQLKLESPPFRHYDLRRSASSDPLQEEIYRKLVEQISAQGQPHPTIDEGANRAAEAICRGFPQAAPPSQRLVEFALRSYGVIEPSPLMAFGEISTSPGARRVSFSTSLANALTEHGIRRVGIGTCRPLVLIGGRRFVILLMESPVKLAPFPRQLPLGHSLLIKGRLMNQNQYLRLFVATPRQQVEQSTVGLNEDKNFRIPFRCAQAGAHRIELCSETAAGETILFNIPLFCQTPPPRQVSLSEHSPQREYPQVEALEQLLLQQTNAFRQREGLKPLKVHTILSKIARQYSEQLRVNQYQDGSASPSSPLLEQLRVENISFRLLLKNVTRVFFPEELMPWLTHSPANVLNLKNKEVTDIGIGISLDHRSTFRKIYATQIFMTPKAP